MFRVKTELRVAAGAIFRGMFAAIQDADVNDGSVSLKLNWVEAS